MRHYHKTLVQDRLWAVLAFITNWKTWGWAGGIWLTIALGLLILDTTIEYPKP